MSNTASGHPNFEQLVLLARRSREAQTSSELAFIAVNETHQLAPYRQASLWFPKQKVVALSGVVAPEANAPYVQWLEKLCRHLTDKVKTPQLLDAHSFSDSVTSQWSEWLPTYGVYFPVYDPNTGGTGAIIFAREQPWQDTEIIRLQEWLTIWSQANGLLNQSKLWHRPADDLALSSRKSGYWGLSSVLNYKLWLSVVIIAALFIPVNLTVLAPAQLIPFQPASVRAPMNGVIEKVLVEPNQQVERHTPLFEYDRSEIKNRMQVAEGAIAILEAEYRQKSQLAVFDQSSKGMLAMIQGEISEKAVELEYLKDIDKRSLVLAPEAGMVLFDDPSEWVGRPVVTGEKMMLVAVQDAVEIEAWLSPADVIPLDAGAPVSLYLNSDPLHSFSAQLRYVGFEALQRPDGHYAYRVRARLDGVEALPQVGLKGTAKIEGEEVTLAYWIFRRPLASLRAWLGW